MTGPLMVGRTVAQYIQGGIAGLHIEDQVINKRCGHLRNKELVDESIFASRIQAAVNARSQSYGDIVIIARSDALQVLGYEATVARLKNAIKIGADAVFPEGITSKEEAKRICTELAPTPVLLNMVRGGVTPHLTVNEAHSAGFRIIIYPGLAVNAVYKAVSEAVLELSSSNDLDQTTSKELSIDGTPDVFVVCGLESAVRFDNDAGGTSFTKGI